MLPVDTLENTCPVYQTVFFFFLVLPKPELYLKIMLSILFVLYYNIYDCNLTSYKFRIELYFLYAKVLQFAMTAEQMVLNMNLKDSWVWI